MAQSAQRPQFLLRDFFAARAAVSARHSAHTAARPVQLRAFLVVASALSIGLAAWFGDPSAYLNADPALARLLRAMAMIKGLIVTGALGAVLWRFGLPISKPAAIGYAAGACVLAGSTMLIWRLTLIPLAAILFHSAALSMLIMGWRER
jgi:hypothetical protein